MAFDVAREGLKTWAGDKELRQVMALALAHMGSTELARDLLIRIRDEGHDDEESVGLLARTYKDLWLRSGSRAAPGSAHRSGTALRGNSQDWRSWSPSRHMAKCAHYFEVRDAGGPDQIQQAFLTPKVAIFEGRWPGDPAQLAQHLKESGIGVAYSSAAAGAEIEFLEAMHSIGGQTHLALPYNEEQFIKEKVVSTGADWEDRYRKVRDAGHEMIVCSDQKMKFENIGNEYAWDVMRGLAKIHAGQLETELVPIRRDYTIVVAA